MKKFLTGIFALSFFWSMGQSIHQEQLEYYNQLGHSAEDWERMNTPKPRAKSDRGTCTPERIVFGWHPYWANGLQGNYDWNLITDFSYFSYEVDPNTGNALTTHSWATAQAVTDALNAGKRVNLCVTLFSNHATFFSDPQNSQTLITNLINLVQSRGAHGVNIDFEGIPSAETANFTNFMVDLSQQMHAAIPGSQVSTVLYAVDWNNVFDIANLEPYVDLYTIMGYGYHWSGSSQAGPTDPLFPFAGGSSCLSKTVTYYLDQGVPNEKLILGLPYYGREWPTTSQTVPSSTTGSGTARTYAFVRNNTSGYYSPSNMGYDGDSFTRYWTFNNGSEDRQCFVDSEYDMDKRLEFINQRDIGGMAIWALSYDDGYNNYWDVIYDNFTPCGSYVECVDTLYDMGGPGNNYFDDEDYTYTIDPDNATSITVQFNSFDIELNYDYLYIYDGPSDQSPQIPGSPFTGTTSPGTFSSSTGVLTFRFTSDGATTTPGWEAVYQCNSDLIPPSTVVDAGNAWETMDFNQSFTDNDNGLIDTMFYNVADWNGNDWRSNGSRGFYHDEFSSLNAEWTQQTGPWSIASGAVNMSDEAEQNSNLWTNVAQDNSSVYLYTWKSNMGGTGTNRRSGIHFFCDDPTQTNRGNSYFVYWRVDSDKCQIYKVVNNTFTLMTDDAVQVDANVWHDYAVTFDPNTGEIKAWIDGQLSSSWTDPSPFTSGNSVSLRSGGTDILYDDLMVWKSRESSATITMGSSTDDIRYQNPNPWTEAAMISSMVVDEANNWSSIDRQQVNIDWTEANPIIGLSDGSGADLDTFYTDTQIDGNWLASVDTHSTVMEYHYSIGTTPGDSDVVSWTNNGLATSFSETGLSLTVGQMYYISARSVNGAGIVSTTYDTDGALLLDSGVGIAEVSSKIKVYPNPAISYVIIESPSTEKVELYNRAGQLVREFVPQSPSENIRLSVEGLATGIYTLKIKGPHSEISRNLIVR